MGRARRSRGIVAFLSLGILGTAAGAGEDLGLRVPPGFKVTLYADESLANDIYAMTLDPQGRVVVTGRGYIKTLHDTQGHGKADVASLFATTETGGMGLCFDASGHDLFFCGDGWLSRYHDGDGDGRADGPPERILAMKFAEHGGHAMRQGPDGWWYAIGGNETEFGQRHTGLPGSPIRNPEAGSLLRFRPDVPLAEVIAQGFRNPYDFDFNPAGDLFTYDSDTERDVFLPWYVPTRIYHIAYALHHGWRLPGFKRSWPRPTDSPDTVDPLWPVGRGSPTGVTCYRHDRFPAHYQGGLFALDWTFGKVYFFPLRPDGASYRTEAEVFLESTGTHGFAPNDVAVAPDGSLFLSIGGRRTRGAVYRVENVGDGRAGPGPGPEPSGLDAVLRARQPLDPWSRARWMPIARDLGPGPFLAAIGDDARAEVERVRAVEVVTELFGGLTLASAKAGARSASPMLRARVAWSLGRLPCDGFASIVLPMADDPDPHVRVAAMEALADRVAKLDAGRLPRVVLANLDQGDKRVRLATARLAALLPDPDWKSVADRRATATLQARLVWSLADVWRHPGLAVHDEAIATALGVLGATHDPAVRMQAVRLIVLALGDYHLYDPPVEVETAYALAQPLGGREATVRRILEAVRPIFPSGHERLDDESARLLAMLEDDDPATPGKVADFWTGSSTATRDFHFLMVSARLRGPRPDDLTPRVAAALLALDRKLQGQEQRIKQSWSDRFAELADLLIARDPRLTGALLRHPDFVAPGHVALALRLEGDSRRQAARRFLEAATNDPDFPWSGPLIELLAAIPVDETLPAYRRQWANYGLRDALLLELARRPDATDRERFLDALDSAQPQVVAAALAALDRLPRDPSPEHLVPLLRLLRRLAQQPKEAKTRTRVLALLSRQLGRTFDVREEGTDEPTRKRAYQAIFDAFAKEHPALAGALNAGADVDLPAWRERLGRVDWSRGEAGRGALLFQLRACQTCHAGPGALGPDLGGVTGRFARDDLFTAILAPNLDVSPLYQTTLIATHSGQVHAGMVAFESADGLIVQTGATTTVRIADADIADRQLSHRSLMPSGLLDGLKDDDLADLYQYLQTLGPRGGGGSRATR